MDSNTIGSRIKALREHRGVTQAEVAEALHVKRQTVDQWENGTRDLKTQYTVDLADFFGVSCDEILRGIKAENLSIYERTGLSDKSVEVLESVLKPNHNYIAIVNKLIENGSLELLCHEMEMKLDEGIEYDKSLSNINSKAIQDQLDKLPATTADLISLVGGILQDNKELLYEFRAFRLANVLNRIVGITYDELLQDALDKKAQHSKVQTKHNEKLENDATETDNNGKP